MIGWKARGGYIINTFPPKSLSDLVITDENGFWSLLELKEIPKFIEWKDADSGYEIVSSIIGSQVDVLYSAWNTMTNNTFLSRLKQYYPSLFLAFPKMVEHYETKPTGRSSFIWVKSSNRIQCTRSDGINVIVEVEGDSLIEIARYSDTFFNMSNNTFIPLGGVINYPDNPVYTRFELNFSNDMSSGNLRGSRSTQENFDYVSFLINNMAPDVDFGGNPYEPGGPSGPGGGDGSFDNDSDQIVDSSLPTLSSANTGFTRIYNPSLSQVQALARYLWTEDSVIQTIWNHIKQYFEDPMQAIIGFNLVPVPVPNGGTQNFALMYIDTGVEMTVAASQFVDVDCGTFELKEYYGSALDYAPNTKVSCFLPFIGTVSLNTDEVMGRTLQVKYRVDICSGSCVAKISVDGNFIYQYSGHCAINIPISSADFSSYVSSAISVAQLAAGAIAAGAGGVMASTALDATQQTNQVVTTTQITNTARNPATGRQITTGTMTRVETRESPNDQSSTQASFSGITPQNISNTVGQIMSSKPNINHSGSFSGNSGYLGVRRPFLIIERPNMCMPSNFQALNGFPSMITLELASCKGFTRVQQVQLTGFYATNPEQAEILQLLKSGVIL